MSEQRGMTALGDGTRVPKSDARLAAIAHCDDASASLGMALTLSGRMSEPLVKLLAGVQNDLLDLSADLHTPVGRTAAEPPPRIDDGYIDRLRYLAEFYGQDLRLPERHVLPGGTAGAALLHKARGSVRLAEVRAWEAIDTHGEAVNPLAADYLNELERLLLVLARAANAEHGDTYWVPGLSAAEAADAERAVESAREAAEQAGGEDGPGDGASAVRTD